MLEPLGAMISQLSNAIQLPNSDSFKRDLCQCIAGAVNKLVFAIAADMVCGSAYENDFAMNPEKRRLRNGMSLAIRHFLRKEEELLSPVDCAVQSGELRPEEAESVRSIYQEYEAVIKKNSRRFRSVGEWTEVCRWLIQKMRQADLDAAELDDLEALRKAAYQVQIARNDLVHNEENPASAAPLSELERTAISSVLQCLKDMAGLQNRFTQNASIMALSSIPVRDGHYTLVSSAEQITTVCASQSRLLRLGGNADRTMQERYAQTPLGRIALDQDHAVYLVTGIGLVNEHYYLLSPVLGAFFGQDTTAAPRIGYFNKCTIASLNYADYIIPGQRTEMIQWDGAFFDEFRPQHEGKRMFEWDCNQLHVTSRTDRRNRSCRINLDPNNPNTVYPDYYHLVLDDDPYMVDIHDSHVLSPLTAMFAKDTPPRNPLHVTGRGGLSKTFTVLAELRKRFLRPENRTDRVAPFSWVIFMTSKRIEFVATSDEETVIRRPSFQTDYVDTHSALAYIYACITDRRSAEPLDWSNDRYLDSICDAIGTSNHCLIILDDLDSLSGQVTPAMDAEAKLRAAIEEQSLLAGYMDKLAMRTQSRARIIITSRFTLNRSLEMSLPVLSEAKARLFAAREYGRYSGHDDDIPPVYVDLVNELSEGVPLFIIRLVYLCTHRLGVTIWSQQEKRRLKAQILTFTLNTTQLTKAAKDMARVLFVLYGFMSTIPVNLVRMILFDAESGSLETAVNELHDWHIAESVQQGSHQFLIVRGEAQLMRSSDTDALPAKNRTVLDHVKDDTVAAMAVNYVGNEQNIVLELLDYVQHLMQEDERVQFADRVRKLLNEGYVQADNREVRQRIQSLLSAMLDERRQSPQTDKGAASVPDVPQSLTRWIGGAKADLDALAEDQYDGWQMNLRERIAMINAAEQAMEQGALRTTTFNTLLTLILTEITEAVPVETERLTRTSDLSAMSQLLNDVHTLLDETSSLLNLATIPPSAEALNLFNRAIVQYGM